MIIPFVPRAAPVTLPPGPLDASLALAILARRSLRRGPRHLLPSAPLLGRPARRLARALRRWSGATRSLAWRDARRGGSSVAPHPSAPPHVVPGREPAETTRTVFQLAPRVGSAAEPPVGSGGADDRSAVPRPRDFAVAPALVWFSRWRELRVQRTVQERRAWLRGDGVRPPTVAVPRERESRVPRSIPALAATQATPPAPAGHRDAEIITMAAPPSLIESPPSLGVPRAHAPSTRSHVPEPARGLQERPPGGGVAARPVTTGSSLLLLPFRVPVRATAGTRAALPRLDRDATPLRAGTAQDLVGAQPPPSHAPLAARPALAQALSMVTQALRQGVATEIRTQVERAVEQLAGATPATVGSAARNEAPPAPAAVAARLDDSVVTALLERMRLLAREERFRRGQLR